MPLFRDRAGARAGAAAVSGWVAVAGLGPGDPELVTPEVTAALAGATDLLGYGPYLARLPARPGQDRHETDNREELSRAEHALTLAASGRRALLASSGDPGVFAMAAALFEAVEGGPADWRDLDIRILPGITAMLAAAARLGAPLGHDFCAINLSDNLKPWDVIAERLTAAARAGFAIALYNPRSRARPEGFSRALELLRAEAGGARSIAFARAVSTPEERLEVTTLDAARPEMADMRTVVIIGSPETRAVGRWLYTPRRA